MLKKMTAKIAAVLLAAACASTPAFATHGNSLRASAHEAAEGVGSVQRGEHAEPGEAEDDIPIICMPESQRSAFQNLRASVLKFFRFGDDPECQ